MCPLGTFLVSQLFHTLGSSSIPPQPHTFVEIDHEVLCVKDGGRQHIVTVEHFHIQQVMVV